MSETVASPPGETPNAAPPAPPGGGAPPPAADAGPGGIFDIVGEGDPPPDADGKPVKPEWLAPEFWDAEKNAPRVEELAKSQRDLRAQISKAGREKPPESPDKYTLPAIEGLPEGVVGGETDTLWPKIKAEAHKAGISDAQLQAVAKPYLEELAANMKRQADAADPTKNVEQRKAVLEAELSKLGPNGKSIARETLKWIDGRTAAGVFSAEEAAALKSVSDAAGVRALMKIREMTGERAIPTEALDVEGGTQQDAERMLAEGYSKADQGMIARARARLTALDKAGHLRV